MSSSAPKTGISTRDNSRYRGYTDLHISFEGSSQEIPVKVPDISTRGMFINTAKYFPQGAVLKISFRLVRTDVVIHTRSEVRYCLEGVGIGVEFVDISEADMDAIEVELKRD
ncbi:MAG: PilZ domain-containing protein [Terriglobales bacterium]